MKITTALTFLITERFLFRFEDNLDIVFFLFILNAKNEMWIMRYNWIKIGNSIGRIEIHSEKARTTESESALEIQ